MSRSNSHPNAGLRLPRRSPPGPALRAMLALVYLCAMGVAAQTSEADPMEALLRGEFALQEGHTGEAAEHYAEAAMASGDPRLLERATRLSLMGNDLGVSKRLLGRWLELAPDSDAALQVALAVALREADGEAGSAALVRLLGLPDGWKRALQAMAGDGTGLLVPTLLERMLGEASVQASLDALLAVGSLADRLGLDGLRAEAGRKAIAAHPQRARAWLWQAEALRKQEQTDEALKAVERALQQPDLDASLRLAAAGLLGALGDQSGAARALAAGEQSAATWAGRAAFLSRSDDREGLQALYAEVQAHDGAEDPERLFLLGQLAELLERREEAVTWYEALPAGARADEAQLRLALLADEAGRHEAAIGALRELQQRETDNGRLLIDAYLLEAQLLQRHDRHEAAVDAYSRGLAVFEDEPALLYGRALANERLGRIDDTEADLRLMLVLDPENPDALNALGYTLADRTERFVEAHELISQALALRPDSPAIIDSMGWVLFRMGRVEEALPHLRRAFELQRDAEVAAHLGEALWASGQRDEARSIWRLGLEIDPAHPALLRSLQQHGVEP